MELSDLHIFRTVVHEGGIVRATQMPTVLFPRA